MKYLFWNTHHNKKINEILCQIILENKITIVILAEYDADRVELFENLLYYNLKFNDYSGCSERIKIFGQINNMDYDINTDHFIIRSINDKDILCCVHLNSQIFSNNEEHREIWIEQVIDKILEIEKRLNTTNTMVVGDFNINPYDEGLLDARYFHGIPIYEETKRKKRIIAEKSFQMFYNPMWNLMGDFNKPYGTYYYAGNKTINPYWNFYDQVIIRPDLRKRFVDESLKIIVETNNRYLLNHKGHPDYNISDHLPIVFEIREELDE